jgi:hypothetical protein
MDWQASFAQLPCLTSRAQEDHGLPLVSGLIDWNKAWRSSQRYNGKEEFWYLHDGASAIAEQAAVDT